MLVSHQSEDNEDVSSSLQEVLRYLADLEFLKDGSSYEQKMTHPGEKLHVHVLVDQGITYICITECSETRHQPFLFLKDVRERFSEQPSLISRSYRANEHEFDRDFRPVLVKIMDDHNSGKADKMSAVEQQIEDVRQVLLLNVEKVMERGERLDELVTKTEELDSTATDFRRSARTVFVQARCRNLKLWLFIGVLIIIFVTVVVLFATGVIKSQ